MTRGEWWPQANLRAGYHFNGNGVDFSGNGLYCTGYGGLTYPYRLLGQAAESNGTTGYLKYNTNNLDNPLKTASFSAIGWIYTNENWAYAIPLLTRGLVGVPNALTHWFGFFIGIDCNPSGTPYAAIYRRGGGSNPDYGVLISDNPLDGISGLYGVSFDKSTGNANLYWNGQPVGSGNVGLWDVSINPSHDGGYSSLAILPTFSLGYGGIDELLIFTDVKDAAWHRRAYEWLFGIYQEGGLI